MKQSVILKIHGRVQGVGFRYFVLMQAELFNIAGFVKNISNGIVYVEAEGDSRQLEFFVQACREGPSHAWVEKVDIQDCPVQNLVSFERK